MDAYIFYPDEAADEWRIDTTWTRSVQGAKAWASRAGAKRLLIIDKRYADGVIASLGLCKTDDNRWAKLPWPSVVPDYLLMADADTGAPSLMGTLDFIEKISTKTEL